MPVPQAEPAGVADIRTAIEKVATAVPGLPLPFPREEYMRIYTAVHTVCVKSNVLRVANKLPKFPGGCALYAVVYAALAKLCSEAAVEYNGHANATARRFVAMPLQPPADFDRLGLLGELWLVFSYRLAVLCNVFAYLDRHIVPTLVEQQAQHGGFPIMFTRELGRTLWCFRVVGVDNMAGLLEDAAPRCCGASWASMARIETPTLRRTVAQLLSAMAVQNVATRKKIELVLRDSAVPAGADGPEDECTVLLTVVEALLQHALREPERVGPGCGCVVNQSSFKLMLSMMHHSMPEGDPSKRPPWFHQCPERGDAHCCFAHAFPEQFAVDRWTEDNHKLQPSPLRRLVWAVALVATRFRVDEGSRPVGYVLVPAEIWRLIRKHFRASDIWMC